VRPNAGRACADISASLLQAADSGHLAPATIKRLLKEFASIAAAPLEGVTLIPTNEDLTSIQALIEGPVDTPYEGGVFRVRLKLSNDFPAAPPKGASVEKVVTVTFAEFDGLLAPGVFVTKIFHPNVSAAGEICVNTLKRDWSPALGIKHILLSIKCLLIEPNPDSALNDEAGKMLNDRYEDFRHRAASWTTIHASNKKDRELIAQLRAGTSSTSTASTASTAAVAADGDEIRVDAAAAADAARATSLTIDDAAGATADTSSTIGCAATAATGDSASEIEADDEGAVDKENNKSNDPAAAARLAASADVPVAKKPKSAAAATPAASAAAAAAAKKKLNRRL
jgi:ubiquitin-conjugating enzyme E2 S